MILVIGDIIIDEYIFGTVDRISPEAPVPVLKFQRTELRPGGAANVAANIRSLGEECMLLGVSGITEFPQELHGNEDIILSDFSRPTSRKTRFVSGQQQILRMDVESTDLISYGIRDALVNEVKIHAPYASAVVISDYGKGVVTDVLARAVIDKANSFGIPVIVDPKKKDFRVYDGASILTPNKKEYAEAVHGFDGLVLESRGAEGMVLHTPSDDVKIPAITKSVIDVTGAGDTVVAALAVYASRNFKERASASWDWLTAAKFANKAAGVVVSKQGTATVTMGDIEEEISR